MPSVQAADDGTAGYGVYGSSPSAIGVEGEVGTYPNQGIAAATVTPAKPKPPPAGVVGYGLQVGAPTSTDISDTAATYGVYGQSFTSGDGVYGVGPGPGSGVHGFSGGGYGVFGENPSGTGIHGVNGSGSGHPPVSGTSGVYAPAIWGDAASGNGVYGSSNRLSGVEGDTWSPDSGGVTGKNNSGGPGILGYSSGNAGQFEGNVAVSGTITAAGDIQANAGQFEGNVAVSGTITVDGDVVLQNADCAEDFDVIEGDLPAGAVVVMGSEGKVQPCDSEYATTVVGIISGAGGLRPGITLDRQISATRRMPVALMGKVYCKVDASSSPISVGDLLTTCKTRGHAMRATDPSRAFGSVIGKALGTLAQGQGIVLVLISLQ